MKKAQAEVRKFYQGNKGVIHEKDIETLSYLKCVIKVLRINTNFQEYSNTVLCMGYNECLGIDEKIHLEIDLESQSRFI